MKRVSIYFIIGILLLVLSLKAQEQPQQTQKKARRQVQQKENPFNSLMGIKWGTDGEQFENTWYSPNFPIPGKLNTSRLGFDLDDFKLGDVVIKKVYFFFKSPEEGLTFHEFNYAKFKFTEAMFLIDPDQFEAVYDIFNTKYGKPNDMKESEVRNKLGAKFEQKIAIWINGDRIIRLQRYNDTLDEGSTFFGSISEDKKAKKEKEGKKKEAADKL